jgi:hypothetical protein
LSPIVSWGKPLAMLDLGLIRFIRTFWDIGGN